MYNKILKIINNFEKARYIEVENKRGTTYQLEPFTLILKLKDVIEYIDNFADIEKFKNLCTSEFAIYQSVIESVFDYDYIDYVDILKQHPFWTKESADLAANYIALFRMLPVYDKDYLYNTFSKNNIAVNKFTCITSIQLIGHTIIIYQRSCDFSLGFLADLILIMNLCKYYNIDKIIWHHACLHIYRNNYGQTITQYIDNKKYNKFIFNTRK